MATTVYPRKNQTREFARWKQILEWRERGVSVSAIAKVLDVTRAQVYNLIKQAEKAKERDWI